MKAMIILTFWTCRFIFLILLFSVTGMLPCFLSAQDENMIVKLTDAEIRNVIPILKAEIGGQKNLLESIDKKTELQHQLFLDIQSGKTDPLDWLKKHSKHIIIPPGAIYQPACSREASIKIKELYKEDNEVEARPGALPTAIFTYGKDFPAINKHLLGNNLTQESYLQFMVNPYDGSDPSVEKMMSVIKDAYSFYSKNGFHTSYGMSSGTILSFYHPEEEGYISGVANIFDWTLLDPSYPDVIKQCRSYIMGPVIEITAEFKLMDKILGSPDNSKSTDENIKNSLKKAGISEDRYAMLKGTLLNAYRDREFPEGIEVPPPLDFTPTNQEEKEMAKIVNMVRENALNRKENIKIYNKFKTELDPIIETFQKNMGL